MRDLRGVSSNRAHFRLGPMSWCGFTLTLGTVVTVSMGMSVVQAQAPSASKNLHRFEVASVKVDISNGGRGDPVFGSQRLTWRGATMKRMICEAYNIQYAQVLSAPSWSDTERYEVEATTEAPSSRDEIREMLRNLLVERFRLVVRTGAATLPVYVLTVAKGGLKLKEMKPEDQNKIAKIEPGINRFVHQASMPQFAGLLSQMISGPIFNGYTGRMESREDVPAMVVDQTGLKGTYDIDLNLNSSGDGDFTATLIEAVGRLGLNLKLKRVPVETIVVTRLERIPTVN